MTPYCSFQNGTFSHLAVITVVITSFLCFNSIWFCCSHLLNISGANSPPQSYADILLIPSTPVFTLCVTLPTA